MPRKTLVTLSLLTLLASGLFIHTSAASACSINVMCQIDPRFCEELEEDPDAADWDTVTQLYEGSDGFVLVVVNGNQTLVPDDEVNCATAVPELPEVLSITDFTMYDSKTGEVIHAFQPNHRSARSFAAAARRDGVATPGIQGWWGFSVTDKGEEPGIRPATFVFGVQLTPGNTVDDLANAFREVGVLATGSARPNGTLDGHHYHFNRFGDSSLSVIYAPKAPATEADFLP